MVRKKAIIFIMVLSCLMFAGCSSDATSFDEEYQKQAQEEFNEKADDAAEGTVDSVKGAVDYANENSEEIEEQAKSISESADRKARNGFTKGLESLDEWKNTDMTTSQLIVYYAMKAYYFIRALTPMLVKICWILALIMLPMSIGNKRRRQFAVFGLGIGFPCTLFLIRYMVPWMIEIFVG